MTRLVRLLVLLAACGSSPPSLHNTTPPRPPPARLAQPPQSLDEAMAAHELTRIELAVVRRTQSSVPSKATVTVRGGTLFVFETAGWDASPSVFARRASDGAIVMVRANVHTIVDRKVAAGCMRFAGGRGWFETVEYQLPQGEHFGGVVEVAYDHHVEVPEYSNTEPDGSPCPPPAID